MMMRFNTSKWFSKNEEGGMSIEAVLAIPMLVWALSATFVFWDAFKTLNISQKATYTVADMLSREEVAITPDYLTAVHEIYDFLAESDGDNALRVSVVTMTEDPVTLVKTLSLVWSEGVGGIDGHDDITPIESRIPDMSDGEQLIIVESEQEWSPAFSVGLASYRFREVALARPRFAPQLIWDAS
jgi:Flp pilus assembly protein TadG